MRNTRDFYNCLFIIFLLLSFYPVNAYGIFPEFVIAPRKAGRPDPRWQVFNWRSVERKSGETNYRLFFDETSREKAKFVEPIIQRQIGDLEEIFGTAPKERFEYVLFTSLAEFREANIFDITEGVRGVTSTAEATMAVPFTGDPNDFQHVSKHEMVHQFQVQKVREKAGDYDQAYLAAFPLWFIEGMAEYISLDGLDKESEHYLRDLLLYPDKNEKYEMPTFFSPGAMNFIFVYKVGQAKIDFLELRFGPGFSQKVIEQVLTVERAELTEESFENILIKLSLVSREQIEYDWRQYLKDRIETPTDKLSQGLGEFREVQEAGKDLDHFSMSPNGRFMAVREIDQLTGRVAIFLLDLETKKRIRVVRSATARVRGLYFQQAASFALSDQRIVYFAETIHGPVLEWRDFEFRDKRLQLGQARRVALEKLKIIEGSSPALKNDGSLAFVGIDENGWPNIYVATLIGDQLFKFKKITNDHFDYSNLQWVPGEGSEDESGTQSKILFADTNRLSNGRRSIVKINSLTGEIDSVFALGGHALSPYPISEDKTFIQSWSSGASQIHLIEKGIEVQISEVKTWFGRPVFGAGKLYALGYRSGRFRIYEIPKTAQLEIKVEQTEKFEVVEEIKSSSADWKMEEETAYKPFQKGNFRVDQLGGFASTGGITGLQGVFSDLMRDYQLSTQIVSPDNPNFFSANLLLSSRRGRSIWTLGAYRVVQPKIDSTFSDRDDELRFFIRTESGGLGQLRYPFNQFGYVDFGLSVASLQRRDFSDDLLTDEWRRLNPESELLISPSISFGYDNVLYELFSGPLEGFSLLFQTETDYLPSRGLTSQQLRFDFGTYVRIYGRSLLAIEGLAAASLGGGDREAFLVSGDDILRAYTFGDTRLTGTYLAAAKAEIRFPLGALFRLPNLRGMVHYDYGSVAESVDDLRAQISSSYGVGIGLSLPPATINFIWAWPIHKADFDADHPSSKSAVFHFTLRYLYF